MANVRCECCGISFKKRNVDIRKTNHNYCSRKCFAIGIRTFNPVTFWEMASRNNINGCLEWNGCINNNGYGKVRQNGKSKTSSRVAYELITGVPIPDGMCVCHHCDNPKCIEPTHLFLGTHSENMHDMALKQRNGQKLSYVDVMRIRYQKVSENRKSSGITKPNGISERTIRRVLQKDEYGEYKYYRNYMPLPPKPTKTVEKEGEIKWTKKT